MSNYNNMASNSEDDSIQIHCTQLNHKQKNWQ